MPGEGIEPDPVHYSDSMNALIITTVLLVILVGSILVWAGEFGKGGEAAKSGITLLVLSLISGYITALASGSL
jgi:uncharacterized membrane protein